MQQKNLVLFLVLAGFIVIANSFISSWLWPPAPPKPKTPELSSGDLERVQQSGPLFCHIQSSLEQSPGAPGIGNPCRLVFQVALSTLSDQDIASWAQSDRELVARTRPKAPPKVVPPSEDHLENIPLGDDSYNLKVLLTSKGAGVQEVVFTNPKFQKADDNGQPVWKDADKKIPEPLDLIPDDAFDPSFVLYHYAPSDDHHPDNPLETLGKIDWKLESQKHGEGNEGDEVVFTAKVPDQDVLIRKTFTLKPGDYHIGLAVELSRAPSDAATEPIIHFRYQLAGPHGLPIEGKWYTNVYRNSMIGQVDAKGNLTRDLQDAYHIGIQSGGTDVPRQEGQFIQYAGIATQYFASMIVVDKEQEDQVVKDGRARFLAWARPTFVSKPPPGDPYNQDFFDDITVRAISEPIDLKPGDRVVHKYLLYHGPVKVHLLAQLTDRPVADGLVDRYENGLHLDTLTDYGGRYTPGIWTQILVKCTNVMHKLLWAMHTYLMPWTWSYGLCIILLTLMVRGMMYPLSRRQTQASAKMQAKMQELAPEVKKLEEKFKNDSLGLQQAKNELYMKRGVNFMATAGTCWIVFLQMPIFLGLYYSLQESIHFRLAPFLWIHNLAAPDMLIRWTDQIPFISRPQDFTKSFPWSLIYLGPYFNILPIIAVCFMIFQQKMLTPPPTDEQQAMQQKMMKYMMVFFGLMFYKVAAGLCLYFITSSLWGLTERKLLPKIKPASSPVERKPGGAVAYTATARSRSRGSRDEDNGTFRKMRDFWDKVLKEARKK